MKLTTEKILPYVLHGVQLVTEGGLKFRVQPSHFPNGWVKEFDIKLILRPLNTLFESTKTIGIVKEELNCTSDEIMEILNFSLNECCLNKLSVGAYNVLCRNKIDIFGLIDAGLAIDINTLK